MLSPKDNRLDYGKILAPPPGFLLDFAVGTTYSLDLDALVGASLALGLSEETDSELMNNPICLLEALRSTGDKVALFCEGGQIYNPNRNKPTPLYILLEKMVFPVKTAKRHDFTAYPSFHPKFWLIRYRNKEGSLAYRVIILSRNLTFDRSWDVTYTMDGCISETTSDKNEPICDFLRYLVSHLPSNENGENKAKVIKELIHELPNVCFTPPEKEFIDFEFIPNGIRKAEGDYYTFAETPLFRDTFHEILIMSPFLSADIIRSFNNRNKGTLIKDPRYMLITREASLGRLKPEDADHFTIYIMKDSVIDGEASISEETQTIRKQDIHAKVYMVRKYAMTDLYLGSLNASHYAVYANVEFMIRLRAKNRYLNMDVLTKSLFGSEKDGSDNPFQPVTLQNAIIEGEDETEKALSAMVDTLNRIDASAEAITEDEEYYSVKVHFPAYDANGYHIELRPLLSRRAVVLAEDIVFEKLTVTQLSEFYVLSITAGDQSIERVIIIPTSGLQDDREKQVISSVISDRDCFYRYIAFLLGDDMLLSMLETNAAQGETQNNMNLQHYHIPALYEKMLQTAAENPEKFNGIDYLLKTVSKDGIIPEEFISLFEKFKKAVRFNG